MTLIFADLFYRGPDGSLSGRLFNVMLPVLPLRLLGQARRR